MQLVDRLGGELPRGLRKYQSRVGTFNRFLHEHAQMEQERELLAAKLVTCSDLYRFLRDWVTGKGASRPSVRRASAPVHRRPPPSQSRLTSALLARDGG